jgi:hypothetical protein
VPAAFIQGACDNDMNIEKKKAQFDNERRINILENIEEDEDPPMPTSFYDIGERIGKWRSKEKHKVNKCRGGNENEPNNGYDLFTHLQNFDASERSPHNGNISIAASSKDRSSVKSSDTALAVARPVVETDTIYEATRYEPFSKPSIYQTRGDVTCTLLFHCWWY